MILAEERLARNTSRKSSFILTCFADCLTMGQEKSIKKIKADVVEIREVLMPNGRGNQQGKWLASRIAGLEKKLAYA